MTLPDTKTSLSLQFSIHYLTLSLSCFEWKCSLSSLWHKCCHTTSWVASSNCLFPIIRGLAAGLSGATSCVFLSQQEGSLVSVFPRQNMKVRSLIPLNPRSYSSLREASFLLVICIGRYCFKWSVVSPKNPDRSALSLRYFLHYRRVGLSRLTQLKAVFLFFLYYLEGSFVIFS